ncbi:MAG: mandelate racemase/muconate lactonizing enzyme family protein [Hyphomicrobiales bacterium]|nr:mandelate racemase/muconate lactonizing enzyme family protein [Hyphomicrobiales bacterium]
MKIEAVDFFYLAMPQITTEADGSQDALLVRVVGGGEVGWGECEASPLVSLAAFVCPMSHGVCRPVGASVLGEQLDSPADIARISARVAYDSMDLLQAPHTFSGIEMALWDLLGKKMSEPVWHLLGYKRSFPKRAYASQLFGETPQETLERGRSARAAGFLAVKFGWGPIGKLDPHSDREQFRAAREGLGRDATLLVDAGQIWREDVEAAAARIPDLEAAEALWLEEPFAAGAYSAYAELAKRSAKVKLAGGEAAHNAAMAEHLMTYGNVGFIQIDCGRIGGIGPAKTVADRAAARGITFVNHTFTSHLALSASLQPFAGLENHRLCEFPFAPKPLATAITANHLTPNDAGEIAAPERPGLGMEIDLPGLQPYLQEVEISVNGQSLYRTPQLAL